MAYPKCIWKNEGKQFMQIHDLITGACPIYLNPPPLPSPRNPTRTMLIRIKLFGYIIFVTIIIVNAQYLSLYNNLVWV